MLSLAPSQVHSLRPATMLAHLKLYKSTLHNPAFTLPFVFLEAVYAMVSHLNGCTYAWTHHSTNMANLRGEDGEGAKQALLDVSRQSALHGHTGL